MIVKNKDTGKYGLTTHQHGVGWAHYATMLLSNFVPFSGYVVNLEKPISKIDPTSNYSILFNSDDNSGIVTTSNTIDVLSLEPNFAGEKLFKSISNGASIYGSLQVMNNIKNDSIIKDFMNCQTTDLFFGVIDEKSAIYLGKHLAEGALYYKANEKRLMEKGISKSNWGSMIRNSTNNITGDRSFTSFEELEDFE